MNRYSNFEPVGFTYSDGSALCTEDAEGRGQEDEDNESGEAGAVFGWEEDAYTTVCDACHQPFKQ